MLTRVQLLLDEPTRIELTAIARTKRQSVSRVARELLQTQLKREKKHTQANLDKQYGFLEKLAKNAVKGPGDSEYDKYAYDF